MNNFISAGLSLAIGVTLMISASQAGDTVGSGYILPFHAGVAYRVYQGNNGPWGHSEHAAFAFDFGLGTGTMVLAARAGTVVKSVAHFDDDNGTPGEENFIVIKHSDGTFARYYHLKKGGSIVNEGQRVSVGQPIAYSGNTGASAGPHLHFDVTEECYEWGCQTVGLAFSNVCDDENAGIPRSGDTVRACPEVSETN